METTMNSEGDMDPTDLVFDSAPSYIPKCNDELKLHVGRKFLTLKEGIDCYKLYAATCGFDIRKDQIKKSSDGHVILRRYVYCNREGVKHTSDDELDTIAQVSHIKKRRLSRRASCLARVVFRFSVGDGYIVDKFTEEHSHPLVSDNYKHFMKCNRNLDVSHQNFILNCARVNIGPMRSFRLFKELVGSYDRIGCSALEFKNFSRDLRVFGDGVDAQILIDRLHQRRETSPTFCFDYSVDKDDKLTRLFWADPKSIQNYQIFGEHVSFDATYATNRYNMIFAPFTGKDNHGKCVTFAAGLLSSEDVDSYVWLFTNFKKCMGKAPTLMITDQDPAMKIAMQQVMENTKHRFCMWHIMFKVSDHISSSLKDDPDFAKRFNDVVWSDFLEPEEFEKQWSEVMDDYGLTDEKWFKSMFAQRGQWIPAYFRDFPMGGLFRTTSMSESENSFFRRYFNRSANLLAFFMNFESAMDAQRYGQDQLNSVDESCYTKLKTSWPIEKHAASIYSISKFHNVQKDIILARDSCRMLGIKVGSDVTTYEIDDCSNGVFSVVHYIAENNMTCACKHFSRLGLLCCHIFLVLKNINVHRIPNKYIVTRWTKYAGAARGGDVVSGSCSVVDENKLIINQLHSVFYGGIGLLEGNKDHMQQYLSGMKELINTIKPVDLAVPDNNGKNSLFERYYGSSIPSVVSILPPDPVKTKGSGSRLKSRKEKASQMMNKPLRKCAKCNQMARHDSRNCDKKTSLAKSN